MGIGTYVETSSKTGSGVDHIFVNSVNVLLGTCGVDYPTDKEFELMFRYQGYYHLILNIY